MRFYAFQLRATALAASLIALSLAGGAAVAQTPPAPAAASAEPAHPHTRLTLKERFAQANTTNDGHLTMEQAKAGLPRVAKNFSVIDKDSKGYVTLTDIQDYYKARRAAHRQTPASSGNG